MSDAKIALPWNSNLSDRFRGKGRRRRCCHYQHWREGLSEAPDTKCTSQWRKGTITDVHSPNYLTVDGIPHHVLYMRSVIHPTVEEKGSGERNGGEADTGDEQEEIQKDKRAYYKSTPPPSLSLPFDKVVPLSVRYYKHFPY